MYASELDAANDALVDAITAMLDEPITERQDRSRNKVGGYGEYGGWIYHVPTPSGGYYSYTVPHSDQSSDSVDIGEVECPAGSGKVASYHTHPPNSKFQSKFSNIDKKTLKSQYDAFSVTPFQNIWHSSPAAWLANSNLRVYRMTYTTEGGYVIQPDDGL